MTVGASAILQEMTLEFVSSELGTLGIEYEAEVIDATTLQPLALASEISNEVQPLLKRGRIGPDLFESTIEFTTGICTSLNQARDDLRGIYTAAESALQRRNATLLGMGLYPLTRSSDAITANAPRYAEIMELIAWPARRVTTNGIHIHVGMRTGDEGVATANSLRSVFPILLALSASSPFRNGVATGLASTRMALFASLPRSGPLPEFLNFAHYASYFDSMMAADAMPTELHAWWDCRLQPALGTLEIRITESIPDLDDALALCALAWCMAVGSQHLGTFQLPNELADENRWRAVRYGSQAHLLVASDGTTQPITTIVNRLIDALSATAQDLDCLHALERCQDLASGTRPHQLLVTLNNEASSAELAELAARTMTVNW